MTFNEYLINIVAIKPEGYDKLSIKLRRDLVREFRNSYEKIEISSPVVTSNCVPMSWNYPKLAPMRKEPEMITATIDTGNDGAKSHLRQRARDIRDTGTYALRNQFGLKDDNSPRTANELIARIKDGKYTVKADRGDNETYGYGIHYIRWRDPSKVEDKAGYELAEKALQKQYTATKDAIIVMEPKEGLAALQAFESTTIH